MKKHLILVFNAGSSSLKYALFEGRTRSSKAYDVREIFRGHFDNHGKAIKNFEAAVKKALHDIVKKGLIKNAVDITAVGHRVVHGGTKYTQPTRITRAVQGEIEKLADLAPLHNPPNLACIRASEKLFPQAKQVAVFDTAFHHTMPEKAFLYGLPYALTKKMAIRRYGFHGISHQYVFEVARKKLGAKKTRRTITCHLGNGCSMTAILNAKVIDTSMGFTPLEGLPMGTRSGDLDPAIIFHLARKKMLLQKIETMLLKESGLLGVSELSSDMRDLWAAYQKKDPRAVRTLEWDAYRIAKYVGAYSASLGGLDCLIFTGGLGEKAFYLRDMVTAYLKHLQPFKVLVIPTNEEKKIAEETARLIS